MTISSPRTRSPDPHSGTLAARAAVDERRNAIAELNSEHEVLCTLLANCASADRPPEQSRARVAEVAERLELHMRLEEDILHGALAQRRVLQAAVETAKVEHRIIRRLVADLRDLEPGSPRRSPRRSPCSRIRCVTTSRTRRISSSRRVRRSAIDLDALGVELRARRGELLQRRSRAVSRPGPQRG